ncbi:hypothetical protein BDZ91DRAFT_666065 [Kalaharituber pfeilii]|nr:hypothetical protein BDZ91DRAFT_666065 [Kalaharituber pfeilii]
MESHKSVCLRFFLLLRNLLYVGVTYALAASIIHVFQNGSLIHDRLHGPSESSGNSPVTTPGHYSRLRPESLVVPKDDYLGPRPHVDTYANYTRLIEVCRGSLTGLEKMRNVYDCLKYLAERESDYYFIPADPPSKASKDYPEVDKAEKPSNTSIGQCPGPIIPYHTYWTGPATWRVELFIKGYLHTQNLPCSRLHIWLDTDAHPYAVPDMLRDPIFAKFLPLVERGDITLKEWKFPSRIPLPSSPENVEPRYVDAVPDPTTGVTVIGDGVIREADGSDWVVLTARQLTFLPVAVSDAVRFVVLHLWGGLYCDMDVLMLRDFRPLLLPPEHSFAERWAVHTHPGDYNTAIMSLVANSSISSYLLRGGVRMGVNFHPRIIGRMAWKDGRNDEFAMFETGLFDPIWGEFNWGREGRCSIPCFREYGAAFIGEADKVKNSGEWESWDGKQLEVVYPPKSKEEKGKVGKRGISGVYAPRAQIPSMPKDGEYDISLDPFPPNNRTMENFFRGAYTYHIHNQWKKHPQPNSWFDVVMRAQDGFFKGKRKNVYGEMWEGPEIPAYETWPEYQIW